MRASGFTKDQHPFYHLTLGAAGTRVYDLSTKVWGSASSLGRDFLTPHLHATVGEQVFAADALSNQIYTLDPDSRTDAGTVFPVEFTAYTELLEGVVPCANVELVCEVGDAPRAGQGSDAQIGMCFSDDGGKNWSAWRYRPLGHTGKSFTRVRWVALGEVKAPYGRIFRFRVSDPVGRRFSALVMNAA